MLNVALPFASNFLKYSSLFIVILTNPVALRPEYVSLTVTMTVSLSPYSIVTFALISMFVASLYTINEDSFIWKS